MSDVAAFASLVQTLDAHEYFGGLSDCYRCFLNRWSWLCKGKGNEVGGSRWGSALVCESGDLPLWRQVASVSHASFCASWAAWVLPSFHQVGIMAGDAVCGNTKMCRSRTPGLKRVA